LAVVYYDTSPIFCGTAAHFSERVMMRTLAYFIAFAPLLALTACRRDAQMDLYLETMNAEKRILEDELYNLEYEIQIRDDRIEDLENRTANAATPTLVAPTTNSRSSLPTPARDPNSNVDPKTDLPEIQAPNIDGGEPAGPDALDFGHRRAPAPKDLRVTHVVVNPRLTGGHNFDQAPGDDGLTVLVEPRNGSDRFVPKAGDVSLVLLDPALQGEAARVARWDLTEEEVTHRLRNDAFARRGIELKLPWSDGPPSNSDLVLFTRYITADGRRVETRNDIRVMLPGQSSVQWTPRGPETANGASILIGSMTPSRGAALKPTGVSVGEPSSTAAAPPQLRVADLPSPRETITRPTTAGGAEGSLEPAEWQPYR